ncbi:RNA polymerase sigma factor [Paenibacillus sp. URB8-2]|uniref:RNA polymerase sigma factor n=1 Tax=Paenibacillus sp. URB8-2 TaxID=2741301 RepID=UPI0015BD52B2|nr:RNA polymerase sigma factor [Paenibacillus sp. URB8-2]BCG61535.1 RNA polymerase sigma factor [Paenibacillus sp. URB8-2]
MSSFDTSEKNAEIGDAIEKVKSGDIQAYTFIVSRFQKPIFIYCFYLMKNQQEAEDAAQDIFIKGLQNIHGFVPTVSFSAWLYKIAYNHCTDLLKKKSRNYKTYLKYKMNMKQDKTYQYSDYINELLDHLSLEEKQILLLRALEEYSYDEIADIMDLNPTTVRKKYERLRKKLIQKKGMSIYAKYADSGR